MISRDNSARHKHACLEIKKDQENKEPIALQLHSVSSMDGDQGDDDDDGDDDDAWLWW